MFWHPMLLAVMAADMMAILLILSASKTAYDVLLSWSPESADRKQLKLETAVEMSTIKVRAGAWTLFFSTIVLLMAISNTLPGIIPGAMCGKGVMQATGDMGNRALAFRFAAIFFLFLRTGLDKLDHTTPGASLIQTNARLLLIALPLVFFSTTNTFQSIAGLEVQTPVHCCAALYDSVRSTPNIFMGTRLPDAFWIAAFITGSILMLASAFRMTLDAGFQIGRKSMIGMILCFLWAIVAAITLVRVLSAYHYQVLYHHCPWCLFLEEHRLVGYPLFGALAAALYESTMAFAVARSGCKYPRLKLKASERIRKAGIRLMAAVSLFLMISAIPAVFWRIKYGVWIGG
jgi:hypothetical protein